MSSKSTFQNFSFGLLKTIVTIGVGIIGTPLLLKYIDEESFGTFKTLTELMGYFQLLEIGLYSTLLNLMIKSVSQSNDLLTTQIQSFGLRKYLKIFMAIVVVGILFFPFQHYLYKNSSIQTPTIFIAYATLILSFIFLPWNVLKAELETSQKVYHIHIAVLIASILTTATSITFSYYNYGLIGLALAHFLGVMASNLYISMILKKSSITLIKNFSKHHIPPEVQKISSVFQKANFLNEISGKVCLFSDQILISVMIGAKTVVPYFITQRLIQIALSQLYSVSNSSWAKIGTSFHQEKQNEFKRNVLILTKIVSLMSCIVLVPILILNKEFINLWVGHNRYGGDILTGITCLNAYLLALFSVWGWTFAAASKSNELTKMMWAQAIVNLSGSIIFTKIYGINGPALGTLLGCTTVPLIQIPFLMRANFNFSIKELSKQWLPPFILSLVLIPLFYYFKSNFHFTNWWMILAGFTLMTGCYLVISYFLVLKPNEKAWFFNLIKSKFGLN